MLNYFKIMFLLLFINICNISANVIIDGINKNIKFQTINSIKYINLSDLSNLLNVNSKIANNQLEFDKEILKFASGSFFIVYENDTKMRVAQMTLPCIEKNNEFLIPWSAFLTSLQGIGLINFEIINNKYIIKSNIFITKKEPKKEIVKETKKIQITPKQNNIIEEQILQDETINLVNETTGNPQKIRSEVVDDTTQQPRKYIIPKGLKK